MTPNNHIISVDWDDTIALWNYAKTAWLWTPQTEFSWNESLIKKLAEYQESGCEIHVTTFRDNNHFSGDETSIEYNSFFLKRDFGLEIKKINYTAGRCKAQFVKESGAVKHYDDSMEVCCRIAVLTEALPVFVGDYVKEKNCLFDELVYTGKIELFE
jgi:hypothetical protein